MNRLKVRRINVNGKLKPGVYAKDITLHIIRILGVKGGIGYAYEYGGSTIEALSMEERMTLCNMSIEGGARVGYVNPDQITFDYLEGREYAPKRADWEKAISYWKSIASDNDAEYDDIVDIKAEDIAPTVTWGINPGQAIGIDENIPTIEQVEDSEKETLIEALEYMKLKSSQPIQGTKINVAFIGSCTNGRISDFEEVAKYVKGFKVAPGVRALVVPGSMSVKVEAEKRGLHKIFEEAGFEWREAGCSMCLAMNDDVLAPGERCASSTNRNFEGRQGVGGRTHLMSPAMVAAAAVAGHLVDVRRFDGADAAR
jgi:3-isopropylmalate/(R)-2-methylmalate dehydratase large subunit